VNQFPLSVQHNHLALDEASTDVRPSSGVFGHRAFANASGCL
jgi:hypothetical protein